VQNQSKGFAVYKNKPFSRFARKAGIPDASLWNAAQLINQGVIDADLGGGVVKQRIARSGSGKSGGSRSIILFKRNDCAVFVYGFEKKNQANIQADELEAFRELAKVILSSTPAERARLVTQGVFFQIHQPREDDNAKAL
jgi:hypothetical protein